MQNEPNPAQEEKGNEASIPITSVTYSLPTDTIATNVSVTESVASSTSVIGVTAYAVTFPTDTIEWEKVTTWPDSTPLTSGYLQISSGLRTPEEIRSLLNRLLLFLAEMGDYPEELIGHLDLEVIGDGDKAIPEKAAAQALRWVLKDI